MSSLLIAVLFPFFGCMHPGTRPHQMASEDHEAAAATADADAAAHALQYDPGATESNKHCHSGKGGRVCWTAVSNPTEAHLKQAEAMIRLAAEHRAASSALRTAEDSACIGIAPEDRDISPFSYVDDIIAVSPITLARGGSKSGPHEVTLGASVTVRAVPGLSTEQLQGIVDCHLARNAALGHVVPEMPDCPLVPKGAFASVITTADGFAVEIRSDNVTAAEDILARARRLVVAAPSTP